MDKVLVWSENGEQRVTYPAPRFVANLEAQGLTEEQILEAVKKLTVPQDLWGTVTAVAKTDL